MREKKGLSQVVTTLILLVVSVLLAAVVTYYATNVTMVRTETEALQLGSAHVWINSTGPIAGLKVQNLGGRDILVDKFTIRGVESAWTNIYIYRVPSGTSISGDMTVCNYSAMTSSYFTHESRIFNQTTDDIPLKSGAEILAYIKDPDNIQMDDLGTTVSIAVFTNNAQYITEVNVESATAQ